MRPATGWVVDRALRLESTPQAFTAAHTDERMMRYQASYWFTVPIGLRGMPIRKGDSFVDFGCGKGRSLYSASWFAFERITGVELDPHLAAIARRNMTRARGPHRLRDVEIITEDARTVSLPDQLRVAFFFNPFRGDVFETVLARLRQNADSSGTPLRVIYANPAESETVLRHGFSRVHRSRHCDVYDYGTEPKT